ncbi:MAG: NAD(P)-dependent oxidoreductase [Verrucomicrobia bacterium]|nr:NAD(P)-dependent oxidoreductase [Verrucomicrobiota bacterium]
MTANPLAADLDHILAHTRGLWEDLRGQRIFLTGGTGFFGCWLLESFVWANDRHHLGAQVTVLTRSPAAFQHKVPHLAGHPAIHLQAGDVRSFDFPRGEFSQVIHAATEADLSVMASDPLQVFDVNVEGTRHVLEFARQAGVRRFLFTSSGAIYGRQPPDLERLPEHFSGGPDPTDTHSAYGIPGEAKRAAESLCALYFRQFGLTSVIARCFTFIGPYLPLDGKFAVGNFLRDALARDSIRIAGDGTPCRSYLYAADLTIWLWTLLLRGAGSQAYNVGSELGLPIAAVAQAVSDSLTPPIPVQIAQAPDPARPGSRYVPCTLKARTELGLRETVDLNEAIRRTLNWCDQCPR